MRPFTQCTVRRATLAAIVVAMCYAPPSTGQSGSGWIDLLDGGNLDAFERIGQSNWRFEDGVLVVDKRTGEGVTHLVTKATYKDFMIEVEFWASDDANSGVFLRCADPKKITDRSCYEVNIFDARPDPTYGTGAIVNFVEVKPMPKAGGRWNTLGIAAKGRQINVTLNGAVTAELHNGLFAEGPLTLQHAAGVVKFRKVALKPL